MAVLISFIELFFVLSVYNIIFGLYRGQDKIFSLIIAAIGATFYSILTCVLKTHVAIAFFMVLLLVAFVFSIKNEINIVNVIVQMMISTILFSIVELIFLSTILLLFRDSELSYEMYFGVLIFFMGIGIIIIKNISKKINLQFINEVCKNIALNIVVLNLGSFMVFIKVVVVYNLYSTKSLIEVAVIFILLIVLNISYLIYVNKNNEFNKRIEINNNINPLINDLMQDMKAKEHEYNNHLTVMYSMIQVCSLEDLRTKTKNYLGDMREKNQYLTEVSYIQNTIVQAIIYNKIKEAEKYDITLNHNIESDLENIKFDDSELTVILSNLINNAIEESKKQLNREIDVYIGELEEKYIIQVSNWIEDESSVNINNIFKLGFSSKGTDRGYGLYNIKTIVDKRKGKIDVKIEKNTIKFNIQI